MRSFKLMFCLPALFLCSVQTVLASDPATLCAEGCRIEKVSEGFYRAAPLKSKAAQKEQGYFLMEEVDMKGIGSWDSGSKTTTQEGEVNRNTPLWERQHQAYERLRQRGELLTPPDPPEPKSGQ